MTIEMFLSWFQKKYPMLDQVRLINYYLFSIPLGLAEVVPMITSCCVFSCVLLFCFYSSFISQLRHEHE